MQDVFSHELATALRAVSTAARICESVQYSISADQLEKKDKSPVTVADFASQSAVCRILELALPDDAVMAEEDSAELLLPEQAAFRQRIRRELEAAGFRADDEEIARWIDRGQAAGGTGRFWTLDPIDGTKGFLRGEQYAISLALLDRGEIQLGVLGCPNLLWKEPEAPRPDLESTPSAEIEIPATSAEIRAAKATGRSGTLFFALRGQGCWGLSIDAARNIDDRQALAKLVRPVRVSRDTKPSALRLCESVESGHSAHGISARIAQSLGITQPPVRMDSQAKYGTVACGGAEAYLRIPTKAGYFEKLWDHAGGVLLVQEAGGVVTDLAGQPLNWTLGRELSGNRGVVVATPDVHARLLTIFSELDVG